jgi:hypothetical protein
MAKIANRRPDGWSGPVKVTDDQYEIWYCKPILLDLIENRGGRWFSSDGTRFISAADATDHLVKLENARNPAQPPPRRKKSSTPSPSPVPERVMKRELADRNRSSSGGQQEELPISLPEDSDYEKFQRWLEYNKLQEKKRTAGTRTTSGEQGSPGSKNDKKKSNGRPARR